MTKTRIALATAALMLFAGTGVTNGQTLGMTPVGDVVMPDGTRAYVLPQTTVAVDVTVAVTNIITGPYARFAQKYFGVIAPLADKQEYTLQSASISYYDPDNRRDFTPVAIPAVQTEIYMHTGGSGEFPRVLPDRRSAASRSPESAAADAAQSIFNLRNRRAELVTGDYAETVFGAGLGAAIERIDRMENEYLELFFGKQTSSTCTVRYYVIPEAGANNTVVCRFRPGGGLLPAGDLSGEPVVLECRPQGIAESIYPPQRRRNFRSTDTEYAVADMVNCRVVFDKRELGGAVIPIYQYGVRTILPAE